MKCPEANFPSLPLSWSFYIYTHHFHHWMHYLRINVLKKRNPHPFKYIEISGWFVIFMSHSPSMSWIASREDNIVCLIKQISKKSPYALSFTQQSQDIYSKRISSGKYPLSLFVLFPEVFTFNHKTIWNPGEIALILSKTVF